MDIDPCQGNLQGVIWGFEEGMMILQVFPEDGPDDSRQNRV